MNGYDYTIDGMTYVEYHVDDNNIFCDAIYQRFTSHVMLGEMTKVAQTQH